MRQRSDSRCRRRRRVSGECDSGYRNLAETTEALGSCKRRLNAYLEPVLPLAEFPVEVLAVGGYLRLALGIELEVAEARASVVEGQRAND